MARAFNNPVMTVTISIALSFLLTSSAAAEMKLEKPKFPPRHWSLDISIDPRQDVLEDYLKTPIEGYYGQSDSFGFMIENQEISSSRGHPFFTRTLDEDKNVFSLRYCTIGYIAACDNETLYSLAFDALNAFSFKDSNASPEYDKGMRISLSVTVNKRTLEITERLEKGDKLPKEFLTLLSLIRRNLPDSYDYFFDYFGAAKMTPLSEQDRGKIRRCQLHQGWMKTRDIPVFAGMVNIWCSPETLQAQSSLFPNAYVYDDLLEDCPDDTIAGTELTLYCPACMEALENWKKQNQIHDDNEDSEETPEPVEQ